MLKIRERPPLTKCPGSGEIGSLYRGVVISNNLLKEFVEKKNPKCSSYRGIVNN